MAYEKLDDAAVRSSLSSVDGWTLEPGGGAIGRRFHFGSFASAIGFMMECALVCERHNHHPEWSNVYSRVDVRLTTHKVDGLTALDFKIASAMNAAAQRRCVGTD